MCISWILIKKQSSVTVSFADIILGFCNSILSAALFMYTPQKNAKEFKSGGLPI